MAQTQGSQVSYGALARLFIRLSLLAFGGPVAHIALAEDEIVTRRKWLTREHYLDLIAATNLIPGPNSTEVMIHVGYTLRGIPGAVLTGACFIVPTFLLTLALSVLYVGSGAVPAVEALLWGIKPVIVAIIANAGYRLVPSALKSRLLLLTFAGAVLAILLGIPEVVAMLGAGLIYALVQTRLPLPSAASALLLVQPVLAEAVRAGVSDVFFYFLKIGSVLFGSGYVLIAYIQQDLVNTFKWLSTHELLDAIAIGQITPGPVSTTATVVGYIVAGLPGAFAATLGIFLPSFVFVILTAPLIPKMRRSRFLSALLDGVNAGVIAAILITVLRLAGEALQPLGDVAVAGSVTTGLAVLLFALALVALVRLRVNATWLILVGGVVGLAVQMLGAGAV